MTNQRLDRDGFLLLRRAVSQKSVDRMKFVCQNAFSDLSRDANEIDGVRARSSRGHVYAARNLISSIPEVRTIWQCGDLIGFLSNELGEGFGLVRALFFDNPPDRTWALGWAAKRLGLTSI